MARREYPIGQAQKIIVDALAPMLAAEGIPLPVNFAEAERLFAALGIVVAAVRTGKVSTPVVTVKDRFDGGFSGGDGDSYRRYDDHDFSALAPWVEQPPAPVAPVYTFADDSGFPQAEEGLDLLGAISRHDSLTMVERDAVLFKAALVIFQAMLSELPRWNTTRAVGQGLMELLYTNPSPAILELAAWFERAKWQAKRPSTPQVSWVAEAMCALVDSTRSPFQRLVSITEWATMERPPAERAKIMGYCIRAVLAAPTL